MTNLERVGAGLGIAAVIFGLGVGWQSINARFDRLNEKVAAIEEDQADSLCLTIMKSQLAAIEKRDNSVREQLQGLSNKHCPSPSSFEVAAATEPMTPEEQRIAEAQRQREYIEALNKLARINDLLAGPDRAECEGPDC